MVAVVALWSALVLTALPASSTPSAEAAVDGPGGHGGPHWRWTGAGACPYFCTCFKHGHLRRVECAHKGLGGVDVGLPRDTEAADLSHNLISSLEDGCFQELGLVQLQELHLQHNAIRAVGSWAFTGLRRLRVLDLSYNHLQTLYANTFASNRGLNTLVLAGNNLARLPADQPLPAAPRLQVLDLSGCRLAHVGAVVLSDMPALANLNLSDNFLIQLQPQALAAQRQLQVLDLTRNPLACDVNTRQFVKQLEARNMTVRHSCPAKAAKEDQSQIISKSMARILADIGGARPQDEVRPSSDREDDVEVVGAQPARPPGRTHEAMLDIADLPVLVPDGFVDGDLVDFDLDEEDQVSSATTASPGGHKDCRTLFPERIPMNPDLVRQWFDHIPSFWASVAGCQVGLVLGLCLSSCLCRRSFWRALCACPSTGRRLDEHARLREQGRPAGRPDISDWNRAIVALGLGAPIPTPDSRGSNVSDESTPCLWRDSFTSLERLHLQRPETPPPAYEDLERGRLRRA
ncbi:uncharacterized protein LOC117652131 [Thrips palmi]|uniref:Uncharacterized protein LOC117652131 n=1 Tax=Thrips palmi TaxID=161013 RepID=A0A6P9A580_THRPL|nr:uncharacterized protein LOC117652131 [Thrips palmi]